MHSPERPSASYQQLVLMEEIVEKLKPHADDITIIGNLSGINYPNGYRANGLLQSENPGEFLEVVLTDTINGEAGRVTSIAIGDWRTYIIFKDKVIDTHHPLIVLEEEEITDLRWWFGETQFYRPNHYPVPPQPNKTLEGNN